MRTIDEKDLIKINRGKASAHVLMALEPVFDRVELTIISKIKQEYLSGKTTETKLLACAAELCTLDTIKNILKGDIAQSESVSKKVGLD